MHGLLGSPAFDAMSQLARQTQQPNTHVLLPCWHCSSPSWHILQATRQCCWVPALCCWPWMCHWAAQSAQACPQQPHQLLPHTACVALKQWWQQQQQAVMLLLPHTHATRKSLQKYMPLHSSFGAAATWLAGESTAAIRYAACSADMHTSLPAASEAFRHTVQTPPTSCSFCGPATTAVLQLQPASSCPAPPARPQPVPELCRAGPQQLRWRVVGTRISARPATASNQHPGQAPRPDGPACFKQIQHQIRIKKTEHSLGKRLDTASTPFTVKAPRDCKTLHPRSQHSMRLANAQVGMLLLVPRHIRARTHTQKAASSHTASSMHPHL